MTDFKLLKKEVYNTPLDIRLMSLNSISEETHSEHIFVDDPRADISSLRAKGIIDGKLGDMFSGTSVFEVTPYISPVLAPKANEEGEGENTETGSLLGAAIATTAYTEQWTLTMTSSTAFTLSGSYSGSQGTGTKGTLFTSTNSDVVIPADAMTGTFATGDKFFFATYKHHPTIVLISTLLATGLIYKGMYSASGNEENISFYDEGMKLLNDIIAGNAGLLGVNTAIDSSDLMVPWEITALGYDISNYKPDEYSRISQGDNYYSSQAWWMYRW